MFRNIYCPWWIADRTSYAYSVDNDFRKVSSSVKFWRGAIDAFYEKYTGIYEYHKKLKLEAVTTGQVISETGRIYEFEARLRRGEYVWPESDIVNYPVQGFSADLMSIIRVSAFNRLRAQREAQRVFFVNTVHDSLVLDLRGDMRIAMDVSKVIKSSFQDCGANFKKIYNKELLVQMDCDARVGINYLWTHKIKI